MSSIDEDIRKIMNLDPFASPFSETFNPSFHSLEALRGAIDALEAGIFSYGLISGPAEVEMNDKADFQIELLNPGGAIIPSGSITPGNYVIHRVRNGTKLEGVYTHAAAAADGHIELDAPYEFTSTVWQPGDLYEIVFSGGYTTIGSTVTYLPAMMLVGRIVREEQIIQEFTAQPAQPVSGVLNADPTEVDDPGASAQTAYGDAAVVKSYEITPGLDGVAKYVYADLTWKVANGTTPRSKWMVCAGDTFSFTSAVDLTDELSGAGTFHRSGQIKLAAMDNVPFTIALLTIVDSGTADVDVVSTTQLRVSMMLV